MTEPYQLQESQALPIETLLPAGAGADEREAIRASVGRLGSRLRRELGLRQDAVSIEDGPEGTVLRARGVAGTITLGSVTFDVRPKHVDDATDPDWRTTLLAMVGRAAPRPAAFTATRRLRLASGTFIDQLAMGLAMELEAATRHAEVRAYRSTREELGQLRGRLLVTEQLRSSILRPHRVVCEVDELSADNPVNRLLHWASKELGTLATQPSVRRALSVQAGRLPDVPQPVRPPTRLAFQLPRQYHHYRGALELSIAFARGVTTSFGAHPNLGGAGFMVGTERLFESFLERSLTLAMSGSDDWQVRAQEASLFARPVKFSGRSYWSRPDNVVRRGGEPVLLVDAKYKRFADATEEVAGGRPSNSDLYQMAAACLAHGCPRALLIYPRMSNADLGPDWRAQWWRIAFGGEEVLVGATTVPLSLLARDDGLTDFDYQLRRLIESAANANEFGTSSASVAGVRG